MLTSEDEQAFERHAAELASVLSEAIPGWVRSAIAQRVAITSPEAVALVDAAAARAHDEAERELQHLLTLDIDAQRTTPLAIARGAVVHAGAVLESLGVPPANRDEHARRLHPDDTYDLTPGGFIDFGDEVQTAGLTWGAAKAHVHKQRRLAIDAAHQPSEVETRIVAVAPNLMDRSRFGSATLVSSATDAMEAKPTLLLVDIDRVDGLADFVSDQFPTVGFGSHVDEQRLAEALDVGFSEALPRSVFFKRLPTFLASTLTAEGNA